MEDVDAKGLPLTFSLHGNDSVDNVSVGMGCVVDFSRPERELKGTVDSRSACTPGAGSLGRRTAKRLSKDMACHSHRPSNSSLTFTL